MTRDLAALGVTPRMHCVLYHALAGEFTQIQLAEQCALDKTTMVVTMDALEKAGLAERRLSSTDRRARVIVVADEGGGVVAKGRPGGEEVYGGVLGAVAGAPAPGGGVLGLVHRRVAAKGG